MNRQQSGERFREIVLPHLVDALKFARWLTGDLADAEDVVQEACIRALNGIESYSGGSARAWLMAIVRNTCFTWLAKHRPQSLVLTSEPEALELAANTLSGMPNPETELIAKADAEAIAQAIAGLPHLSREIVVLRDVNGLSYREIAGLLAIPLGTVMSRLARGRAQLGAELGKRQ